MKAVILYGQEQIRIEEVTDRPLQPGEVRVDIQAALTCGTDLKVFKRGYHAKMIVPPAVFGHELAGVVSEVQSPRSKVQSQSREADEPGRHGHGPWRGGDRGVRSEEHTSELQSQSNLLCRLLL